MQFTTSQQLNMPLLLLLLLLLPRHYLDDFILPFPRDAVRTEPSFSLMTILRFASHILPPCAVIISLHLPLIVLDVAAR